MCIFIFGWTDSTFIQCDHSISALCKSNDLSEEYNVHVSKVCCALVHTLKEEDHLEVGVCIPVLACSVVLYTIQCKK